MYKQLRRPGFFTVLLLFGSLFLLSFAVESFWMLRMQRSANEIKAATSVFLLVSALVFLRNHGRNEGISHFHLPARQEICAMLGLVALNFVFAVFFAQMSASSSHINQEGFCTSSAIDMLHAMRSFLISPALETLIFVKILPESFSQRYRFQNPVFGVIVASALFSLMHAPVSIEEFLYRFSGGIVFTYTYYALNSLVGAFAVHVAHNFLLSIFGALGGKACVAIASTSYEVSAAIFVFCMIPISYLLFSLSRTMRSVPFRTPSLD